jgi:hypothetical protein
MQDMHRAMALAITACTPSKHTPRAMQIRPSARKMPRKRDVLFLLDIGILLAHEIKIIIAHSAEKANGH